MNHKYYLLKKFRLGLVSLSLIVSWQLIDQIPCFAAPKTLHTNKKSFLIPFQYEPQKSKQLKAHSIQLFVSVDQGTHWNLYQTVAPKAKGFQFNAIHDGEYWFTVRIFNDHHQSQTSDSLFKPELKVVVDSVPPTLSIQLKQAEPGQIQLFWNTSDLHLDLSKFQLEYRQNFHQSWKPIRVIPQTNGRTAWTIPQGGMVAVRGTILDKANNRVSVQKLIKITAIRKLREQPYIPDFRQPIADQKPFHQVSTTPSKPKLKSLKNRKVLLSQPRQAFPVSESQKITPYHFAKKTTQTEPHQVMTNQNFDKQLESKGSDDFASSSATIKPKTHYVNRSIFQIDYKLAHTHPLEIQNIICYFTQDAGKSWQKYGNDPDLRSPFQIQVPQEGHYGFAFRIQNYLGTILDPPQAGTKPTFIVVYDQTAPTIHSLSLDQGGSEGNHLLIRWKIEDEHFSSRPIALSYTNHEAGPWKPIRDWQMNSGNYVWKIPSEIALSDNMLIRLTAKDRAGNTTDQTARVLLKIRDSAKTLDQPLLK